ncbi:MAG: hypothetical protein AAFU79_08835 [Myxococcota bacterium]
MANEEALAAESEPTPPKKAKKKAQKDPLTFSGVGLALLRRPLLVVVGALLCGVALAVETAFGSQQLTLYSLASYLPFLGGGWAVLARATSSEEVTRGHLPGRPAVLAFAATALVVVILSSVARVMLTGIGEIVVKLALTLGPTVALADASWPHRALWRGLMVMDDSPTEFLKVAGVSVAVLLVTVAALPFAMHEILGISGGDLVKGFARGLGWGLISALWMRYYLRVRPTLG